MPTGSFKGSVEAKCPFFKNDNQQKQQITCEGLVDKSILALIYRRRKDYDTQLSVFCCEYYKKCEIFRMLMEAKYDEED